MLNDKRPITINLAVYFGIKKYRNISSQIRIYAYSTRSLIQFYILFYHYLPSHGPRRFKTRCKAPLLYIGIHNETSRRWYVFHRNLFITVATNYITPPDLIILSKHGDYEKKKKSINTIPQLPTRTGVWFACGVASPAVQAPRRACNKCSCSSNNAAGPTSRHRVVEWMRFCACRDRLGYRVTSKRRQPFSPPAANTSMYTYRYRCHCFTFSFWFHLSKHSLVAPVATAWARNTFQDERRICQTDK